MRGVASIPVTIPPDAQLVPLVAPDSVGTREACGVAFAAVDSCSEVAHALADLYKPHIHLMKCDPNTVVEAAMDEGGGVNDFRKQVLCCFHFFVFEVLFLRRPARWVVGNSVDAAWCTYSSLCLLVGLRGVTTLYSSGSAHVV